MITEHDQVRAWFDAHAKYVGRCLRYLGVPERELDDAVQEVFLVVHRKLSSFRPGTSERAWLYSISLNTSRNLRRKVHARREAPLEDEDRKGSAPGTVRLEARTEATRLLAVLDDAKREVFVLYHVEELTLAEIAEVLETPLQTIYSRLQAAHKVLEQTRRGAT